LTEIEDQVRGEIEAGVEFADAAPYPDPSEVDQDVYA
jgi:TPP-dependent pyruvate/acetoin dehydrogenase alpha subunit